MKLVFVESSRRAWGSEQHFVNLAQSCHAAGHEVVAVVKADSDVAHLLINAGVNVVETPFRGGADPRALWASYRVIRKLRADWLITDHQKHYWALYFLARLTGTRVALFRHLAYVRGWLTRVILPHLADRFFVVSDFALRTLAEAGAPERRLQRLYNPIDLQRFKPDRHQGALTRHTLGIPDTAYVVGFVGRHEVGKGVDILQQALAQVMEQDPNIYAIWVGNGPDWQHTQQAIDQSKHAHRHRMIEWTEHPEHYLVALDCLVAPSQAVETFGRVVAEAQACGVPLIATRVGGLAEAFVPNRSGLAYKGNNPKQLAQLILNLQQDRAKQQLMRQAGREFVKRFDTNYIVHLFATALVGPSISPKNRKAKATTKVRVIPTKQPLPVEVTPTSARYHPQKRRNA